MSERKNSLTVEKVPAASHEAFEAWRKAYRFSGLRNFPGLALRDKRPDIVAYYIEEQGLAFASDLIIAVGCDSQARLKTLLGAGVDPNEAFSGTIALNRAAKIRAHFALELLINNGANLNSLGSEGETPLMWAAYNGDRLTAELLMEAGADPTIPKCGGAYAMQEPWMLAYSRGHHDLSSKLLEYKMNWALRPKTPALPAPEEQPVLALPAPAETQCPAGWSIIDKHDVAMAVQTIEDKDSNLSLRNVFDFAGKRLLTELQGANGSPLLSEKRFDELDPQLVENARRIFNQSKKKTGQAKPPGLI